MVNALVSKAFEMPKLLVDSLYGIFEGETFNKLLLLGPYPPTLVMKLFSMLFFPLLEVAAVD